VVVERIDLELGIDLEVGNGLVEDIDLEVDSILEVEGTDLEVEGTGQRAAVEGRAAENLIPPQDFQIQMSARRLTARSLVGERVEQGVGIDLEEGIDLVVDIDLEVGIDLEVDIDLVEEGIDLVEEGIDLEGGADQREGERRLAELPVLLRQFCLSALGVAVYCR